MQLKNILISLVFIFFIYDYIQSSPVHHKDEFSHDEVHEHGLGKPRFHLRKCVYDSHCPEHNWCHKGKCHCKKGLVRSKENQNCHKPYKKKSKWYAFVVSFIFGGFGADWFYLARGSIRYLALGIAKLLISNFWCLTLCYVISKRKNSSIESRLASGILGFAAGIWWFVDWFRILAGTFPDGNNVSLRH